MRYALEHGHALLEAGKEHQKHLGFHRANVKASPTLGKRGLGPDQAFSGWALMNFTTSRASQKHRAVNVSAAP